MRQWMVDPRIMCRQHLLGEHVEHHMFIGTLRLEKSITGYLKNNLLEPMYLWIRHAQLVKEMTRRGFEHDSPLPLVSLDYLSDEYKYHKINRTLAREDLLSRCPLCLANHTRLKEPQ